MAVPKRKMSRASTRMRRAQWKATAPTLVKTIENGKTVYSLPHRAKVVEDSPLVVTAKNTTASIASVTLNVDFAKASKKDGGDMWFKVRWIIEDKNGMTGEVFVLNSFALNPLEET